MAPTLAASGNAATLAATAAFEAGGVAGLAATGVVVAGAATAAVVRRRKTVRRNLSARAGKQSATSGWGSPSGASGSSGRGSPGRTTSGGRSGSGSAGGGGSASGRRGGSSLLGSKRSGGGGATGSGGTGPSSKRSPSGLLGSGGKGRHPAGGKHGGASGAGTGTGKSPSKRSPKPGKGAGIKAATGRAVRNALASGSLPRKTLAAVGRHTLGPTSLPRKGLKATGRGTKKAWIATAPHRKTAAKTTARQTKRLAGAARDGLRSLLAGAWAGMKKRDRRAALARIREVWGRRRKARTDKNTPVIPTAVPPVAATARRPVFAGTSPSTLGASAMSGHHFIAPAMEGARAAANYQPTGMMQVIADFAGLKEALELNAEAMKITVQNADAKFPLDPRVIETMRQIHSLQLKAAEMASELQVAANKLHDVDINRIQNPRNGREGERMWDITAN